MCISEKPQMEKLGNVALPILKYLLEESDFVSDHYWNSLILTHFGSPLNMFIVYALSTLQTVDCKKGVSYSYFGLFAKLALKISYN